MYYKQYKADKISKKDFEEIVRVLKELKAESKTRVEFKTKFGKYKKH